MPAANLHTVYMALEVLLVECKACGRRVQLSREDGLPVWQGNMTEVRALNLRCRCGAGEVRTYIPLTEDEAAMWLAGDPLPAARRAT